MFEELKEISRSDPRLAGLLDDVREYACVYRLARQRQKGCDGMGELAMMKEEFGDAIDKVLQYCKVNRYIPGNMAWDLDLVADEVGKS